MSIKTLTKRWIQANLYEGGGSGKDGHWWFRDNVLFYQKGPYRRFVQRGKLAAMVLTLDREGNYYGKGRLDPCVTMSVPDLGVFSPFAGDYIDDKELHQRMSKIMTAQIRDYVNEDVNALSGGDSKAKHEACIKKLETFYKRWEDYSREFGLKWEPAAPLYMRSALALIDQKVEEWQDPINIERRTREHSRRLLKKALDL